MSWENPVTTWGQAGQTVPGVDDFNRIEGNIDILGKYDRAPGYGTATGTNTKAITLSPAPGSYYDGLCFAFKNSVENTGAVTINVNGLGAKAVKKPNGNDVAAGNLKAGSVYTVRYNGSNFILQGEGGDVGTAQPEHVLEEYTVLTNDGIKSGTMTNQGAKVITPSTSNQTIVKGYHNGSGYVKGSANLIGKNIKEGVTIFNCEGTAKTMAEITKIGDIPEVTSSRAETMDGNGNVYITEYIYPNTQIRKYTATGSLVWAKQYSTQYAQNYHYLSVSKDGAYIFLVSNSVNTGDDDRGYGYMYFLDSSGGVKWSYSDWEREQYDPLFSNPVITKNYASVQIYPNTRRIYNFDGGVYTNIVGDYGCYADDAGDYVYRKYYNSFEKLPENFGTAIWSANATKSDTISANSNVVCYGGKIYSASNGEEVDYQLPIVKPTAVVNEQKIILSYDSDYYYLYTPKGDDKFVQYLPYTNARLLGRGQYFMMNGSVYKITV